MDDKSANNYHRMLRRSLESRASARTSMSPRTRSHSHQERTRENASSQKRKRKSFPHNEVQSFPNKQNSLSDSVTSETPRTLVQNFLNVQKTAQPSARKRARVTPQRHKSVEKLRTVTRSNSQRSSKLDTTDLTPRTMIQGFLNHAPVETPVVYSQKAVVDDDAVGEESPSEEAPSTQQSSINATDSSWDEFLAPSQGMRTSQSTSSRFHQRKKPMSYKDFVQGVKTRSQRTTATIEESDNFLIPEMHSIREEDDQDENRRNLESTEIDKETPYKQSQLKEKSIVIPAEVRRSPRTSSSMSRRHSRSQHLDASALDKTTMRTRSQLGKSGRQSAKNKDSFKDNSVGDDSHRQVLNDITTEQGHNSTFVRSRHESSSRADLTNTTSRMSSRIANKTFEHPKEVARNTDTRVIDQSLSTSVNEKGDGTFVRSRHEESLRNDITRKSLRVSVQDFYNQSKSKIDIPEGEKSKASSDILISLGSGLEESNVAEVSRRSVAKDLTNHSVKHPSGRRESSAIKDNQRSSFRRRSSRARSSLPEIRNAPLSINDDQIDHGDGEHESKTRRSRQRDEERSSVIDGSSRSENTQTRHSGQDFEEVSGIGQLLEDDLENRIDDAMEVNALPISDNNLQVVSSSNDDIDSKTGQDVTLTFEDGNPAEVGPSLFLEETPTDPENQAEDPGFEADDNAITEKACNQSENDQDVVLKIPSQSDERESQPEDIDDQLFDINDEQNKSKPISNFNNNGDLRDEPSDNGEDEVSLPDIDNVDGDNEGGDAEQSLQSPEAFNSIKNDPFDMRDNLSNKKTGHSRAQESSRIHVASVSSFAAHDEDVDSPLADDEESDEEPDADVRKANMSTSPQLTSSYQQETFREPPAPSNTARSPEYVPPSPSSSTADTSVFPDERTEQISGLYGYSALKTPHLPPLLAKEDAPKTPQQPTAAEQWAKLLKSVPSNKKPEAKRKVNLKNESRSASVSKTKAVQNNPVAASTSSKPDPKPPINRKKRASTTGQCPALPKSLTNGIFKHFCPGRVSRGTMEEVYKVTDKFFENAVGDLSAFAKHAHRKKIDASDVEILMKRQGFVNDKETMFTLVEKYLPLEYRQEIIPMARSGNIVYPKR